MRSHHRHAKRCIWVRFVSMACTAVLPMAVHAELDLSLPPSFAVGGPTTSIHATTEPGPDRGLWRREAAYLTLHVIDWAQTLEVARLARDPESCQRNTEYEECWEHNPLLGSQPSSGEVNRYFVATGLLHIAVANLLPDGYAEPFQWVTIGIEVGAITNNASMGVRF